jgi:hypothetical protein
MSQISSDKYYTRNEALAAGVPQEALARLRRHPRGDEALYSGDDLLSALAFAQAERRAQEAEARKTERYAYGSLGPPTR